MKSFFFCLVGLTLALAIQAQDTSLLISRGGGVTGMVTVYRIDLRGKVEKGSGVAAIAYTEEGKLKKCTTKKFFRKVKALLKAHPDYDHPGNVYSSLAYNEHSTVDKITWGDPQHQVPENISKLHRRISTALSKVKFKPHQRNDL
jgi:hypothetical protein